MSRTAMWRTRRASGLSKLPLQRRKGSLGRQRRPRRLRCRGHRQRVARRRFSEGQTVQVLLRPTRTCAPALTCPLVRSTCQRGSSCAHRSHESRSFRVHAILSRAALVPCYRTQWSRHFDPSRLSSKGRSGREAHRLYQRTPRQPALETAWVCETRLMKHQQSLCRRLVPASSLARRTRVPASWRFSCGVMASLDSVVSHLVRFCRGHGGVAKVARLLHPASALRRLQPHLRGRPLHIAGWAVQLCARLRDLRSPGRPACAR